jgi:endonuclease/exonuclease/phosphatase (EEP) superfamily protein YafD
VCGDLYVNGVVVKLICAHTTSSAIKICRAQINELIQKFEKNERVIMCGDWNTTNFSQFKKAGYSMANDGTKITYPSKSYALDNIVAKGVEITDVKVVKTDLSDHYPLVCRITIK